MVFDLLAKVFPFSYNTQQTSFSKKLKGFLAYQLTIVSWYESWD